MYEIAIKTANSLTNARFGKAPKMKLNREDYGDIIKAVYLLAQTNTIKDIREILQSGIENKDETEILVGELDIAIVESHNYLVSKTKYGRMSFNKMDVEDLIYEKPLDKLLRNKKTMKPNGFR